MSSTTHQSEFGQVLQPFFAQAYATGILQSHANIGPLRTPQMRAVHEQLDDIVEANRQDGDKVKGAAVIDAYPGLGKSTIAQVFAREFCQRQVSLYGPVTAAGHDRIPVWRTCA